MPQEAAATEVVATLQGAGHQALFAGGSVRDRLLGRPSPDIDIATSASPEEVEELFDQVEPIGRAFGVVAVEHRDHRFEVASFRREGPYSDGRRPDWVELADLEADAQRRDFTVNALYYDPIADEIHDLVDGVADLKAGLIRAVGEPDRRFREDRLRLLRAIRFAGRLDFELESATRQAIEKNAAAVTELALPRLREELEKMLLEDGRADSFQLLRATGLLGPVLPEVAGMEGEMLEETMDSLAALAGPALPLAWSVLLHRLPLAQVTELLRRLQYARDFASGVTAVIEAQSLLDRIEALPLPDLKQLLARGDIASCLEVQRVRAFAADQGLSSYVFSLRKWREFSAEGSLRPKPIIDGRDLIELGYRPGPRFGKILSALKRAQLAGEVTNRDEALSWLGERHPP